MLTVKSVGNRILVGSSSISGQSLQWTDQWLPVCCLDIIGIKLPNYFE